jgi:hypothetical protein
MKQLLNALCIALCALCTSSCGARPASGDTSDVDTLGVHQSFELPEVPAMLTSPEDRLHFVVMHYWDRFDFRDTALIHLPDLTEQALVNYLDLPPVWMRPRPTRPSPAPSPLRAKRR